MGEVNLCLNKFLFTRLDNINWWNPFKLIHQIAPGTGLISLQQVSTCYIYSHLSYIPYRSNFPTLPLKTVQVTHVSIAMTLSYGLETSSFSAVPALSSSVQSLTNTKTSYRKSEGTWKINGCQWEVSVKKELQGAWGLGKKQWIIWERIL